MDDLLYIVTGESMTPAQLRETAEARHVCPHCGRACGSTPMRDGFPRLFMGDTLLTVYRAVCRCCNEDRYRFGVTDPLPADSRIVIANGNVYISRPGRALSLIGIAHLEANSAP